MKLPTIPVLFKGDAWYQNNFFKTRSGNALNSKYPFLWIYIKDVRSYVTAVLRDNNGKVIQIEQTGSVQNPWKDVVKLELIRMVNGKVVPYKTGIYTVTVQGDRGSGDAQRITDEFVLI